jgi:hypothetical protein
MLHSQPAQEIKMDQVVPEVPLVERVVKAADAGLLPRTRHILSPNDAGDAEGVSQFYSQYRGHSVERVAAGSNGNLLAEDISYFQPYRRLQIPACSGLVLARHHFTGNRRLAIFIAVFAL